MKCRIGILWGRWGTYHTARYKAFSEHAASKGWATIPIQTAGHSREYYFFHHAPPETVTLLPEHDEHDFNGALLMQMLRKVLQLKLDILVVPGFFRNTYALALMMKLLGVKVIMMSTNHILEKNECKRIAKSLASQIYSGALVGGQRHKRYLKTLKFNSPIETGYNAVDNQAFAQDARMYPYPDTLPNEYFCFVGRLEKEKHISLLIAAYRVYRLEVPYPKHLLIVGNGSQLAHLKSIQCEGVQFMGHQDPRALAAIYARASALLLPSTRETWGLVINEAFSCGTPAIVSNQCGCVDDLLKPSSTTKDLQHTNTGIVINSTKKKTWAKAMLYAHEHSEKWNALKPNCQTRAKEYGLAKFSEGLCNLIEHVLPVD